MVHGTYFEKIVKEKCSRCKEKVSIGDFYSWLDGFKSPLCESCHSITTKCSIQITLMLIGIMILAIIILSWTGIGQ